MLTEYKPTLQDQYSDRYKALLSHPVANLTATGKTYLEGAQALIDWLEGQRQAATKEDAKKITRTALTLASGYRMVEAMLQEIR